MRSCYRNTKSHWPHHHKRCAALATPFVRWNVPVPLVPLVVGPVPGSGRTVRCRFAALLCARRRTACRRTTVRRFALRLFEPVPAASTLRRYGRCRQIAAAEQRSERRRRVHRGQQQQCGQQTGRSSVGGEIGRANLERFVGGDH